MELGRRGFDEGTFMRKLIVHQAASLMARQVPDAALRARLTQPYPLGCKRIIYSNDFYPTMSEPHVELVTDKIERITPTGIITADGQERALDVLVRATGFDGAQVLSSVKITGLQGQDLQTTWAQGPHAYHGVSVAGFPNMFLMLGPNTATDHTSTLLYIEPEVAHAIDCMRAVEAGGRRWIGVRSEEAAPGRLGLEQV